MLSASSAAMAKMPHRACRLSGLAAACLLPGLAACPSSELSASSGGGVGGKASFGGFSTSESIATSRGINVVVLDGATHEVLSYTAFDTYMDGDASDSLAALVSAEPVGPLV